MLVSGQSSQLTLLFPVFATVLGALLLASNPGYFVGYALWLWMLSPFIRRVVDAQNGWNSQNPILLAPLLVCALCAVDVVRYASRLQRVAALPFVLAITSLCAGVAVGLFLSPPALVLYASLTWIAPVLLGLYVGIHPEHHDRIHLAVVQSLSIGLIVLGIYGVAQFISPAVWDRLWMVNSRMDSIGTPLPFRVRVFSTMNAPGPLAQFLSASMLLLFAQRSAKKLLPLVAGLAIFLLSLARSAWLGFFFGFVLLMVLAPRRIRHAALIFMGIVSMAFVAANSTPLPVALDSMRQTITTRLTTVGDLAMDDSFRARRYLIPALLGEIAERPLGSGLGATLVGGAHGSASSRLADQGLYLDNGILEIFLVLGWFGGALFLLSTIVGVAMSLRVVLARREGYGYLAAAVALITQIVGGTIFAGIGGVMFWTSVGMALTTSIATDGHKGSGVAMNSAR